MNDAEQSNRGRTLLLATGLLLALSLIGIGIFLLLNSDDDTGVTAVPTITSAPQPTSAPLGITALPGEFELDVAGTAPFVGKIAAAEFTQPAPAGSTFASDVYLIEHDDVDMPEGTATLLIPDTISDRTSIDMIGYDGNRWQFMPTTMRGNLLVATPGQLPQALALVQSAVEEGAMIFAAETNSQQALPETMTGLFTELSNGTLKPTGDGSLAGEIVVTDGETKRSFLRVTNRGVVFDSNILLNLLINPDARDKHIRALTRQAAEQEFDGVHVDYQGIPDDMRDNYTNLLQQLHTMLNGNGLMLAVTLDYPRLSSGLWESDGQDWAGIGQFADLIFAQMPLNPVLYTDNGEAEQYLAWATRQVDRRRMMLVYTSNSIDQVAISYDEVANEQAISNFGQVVTSDDVMEVDGGEVIAVELDGTASLLEWDGIGATYKFTYESLDQPHTIWLSNEGALAYRLRLAEQFGVRGVTLRGLSELTSTDGYMAALESAAGLTDPPAASAAAIIWSVTDTNDNVIASSAGSDLLAYSWQAVDETADFVIAADFLLGETSIPLGNITIAVNGSTPTVAPTATPEPEATKPEFIGEGVTANRVRMRQAPGTQADSIKVIDLGAEFKVLQQDSTGQWLQILINGELSPGWVYAELVTLTDALGIPSSYEIMTVGVTNGRANLRKGRGSQYASMTVLDSGVEVSVLKIDSSEDWLKVILPGLTEPVWVFADLVTLPEDFDTSTLPIER